MKSLDTLRATVAVMRELGVTEFDGIKLGPVPPTRGEPVEVDELERSERAAEARHRTLFASVRGVPPLHGLKAVPDLPRMVVQRREAQEHGDAAKVRKHK